MHYQHPAGHVFDQNVEHTDSGSVVEVFRVKAVNSWISLIIGIILVCAAGLAAVYALIDISLQVITYGPVLTGYAIFVPVFITILLLISGTLLILSALFNWKKSVVVYDKGLSYTDRSGIQDWDWSKIEWFNATVTRHYHLGIYSRTTYQYTLKNLHGSALRLNDKFTKIETLGQIIGQKVTPIQFHKILHTIRAGQTIKLGPITMDRNGLAVNQRTYSWDDVDAIKIKNGYLQIRKRGGGHFMSPRTPVSAIPNLDALVRIISQVVKVDISN